jgi:membrane protein implicated in regulation of membrane protease activity
MRRILISLSSLVAVTAAFLSTGTAAFAMRVSPPSQDGSAVRAASVVHHSAGLDPWQIALITVAGLIVLAAVAVAARFSRTSRRHSPTPAAT